MAQGFTRTAATSILVSRINNLTYVALSTTTPNEDGGNFTEPSPSHGYKRNRFGSINTSIPGQVTNDEIIFLYESTGEDSITHVGLSDKEERGTNVFLMAQLLTPLTVSAGYVPLIRAKNFIIGLDKEELEAYV